MIHRGWRWVMRFDLSDDEWALLEPLMPKSRKSAHGTDRHGNPALVAGAAGRVALYRAGQAAAECLYRELQRAAARRDALHFAQSRAQSFGDLEGGLQHHPPAPRARQSAASRLCQTQRPRNATGRDAALHRGLRAPSRCITEPPRFK